MGDRSGYKGGRGSGNKVERYVNLNESPVCYGVWSIKKVVVKVVTGGYRTL